MKQNAKEYLIEFANDQPNWLKALIYDSIETNGNITDDRIDEILSNLTNHIPLSITEPNLSINNTDSEIRLTELLHKSGVNALSEGQKIKFSNDVTILYGMNGAGKSSYFKVLNEIVGGNQKKEILSNIYTENTKPIAVEVSFNVKNGQNQKIDWNNNERSLKLLNKCKVFDSSYMNGLLEVRKTDTTLIQPLSLNLFTYLVRAIDAFKANIKTKADNERLKKPVLELEYLKSEVKTYFENHNISDNMKSQIEKFYTFSDDNSELLKSKEKALKELKQVNIQDKILLKKNDKRELESIKNHIGNRFNEITKILDKVKKILIDYSTVKIANNLAKKQFKILSEIPGNNTNEWKEFIKAGERYTSKLDNSEKVCAYCRQPLNNENSIKLIQAYGSFLKDESEQKLSQVTQNLEMFKQKLNRISFEFNIKDNLILLLKKDKADNLDKTLMQLINDITSNLDKNKTNLISIIDNKDFKKVSFELEIKDIVVKKLSEIIKNIETKIKKFEDENKDKKTQIDNLEKEINSLLGNKSISEQQANFEKWFKIDSVEKDLREKESKIKTTKITNLSKIAHNDLLSETLKTNFIDELSNLGYKRLEVKLETARSQKGASNTKLTLSKNNVLKAVLSEGEQKAVALALFIAETKIQKSFNPIILDDPVNSLDHKIAGKFANRLLLLENQIILFNHNKLFLDAFETSKENHICKTIDSVCNNSKGKHIRIYQVNNEGKFSKGVLTNYKLNKAKIHIKDVKRLLNKSPFEDWLKVSNLLRKAVECTIDEKIFNNQVPTKNSTKNNRINWEELKKLNNDETIINSLKSIHGRVSGAEMHNGTENEENPIDLEEFNTLISELESIINI